MAKLKPAEGGWVKIDGHKWVAAIRKAGVPFDGMVYNDRTYAPRWVNDAIKLYESNSGYADMDLAEFLKRMNPKGPL